jgi:thymidylate synthase (FAD)
MPCDVRLISYTMDPARVVAAAAKLCYSASEVSELMNDLTPSKIKDFLLQLRSVGHLSPFEHANFTYAVEGISRVASHQLVRHRLASYSQQSQRYVTSRVPKAVIPPEISRNKDAAAIYEKSVQDSYAAYERLAAMGIPKEDARFILPNGWETSLILTMNARELHHFFHLRLCRRAQWEIRALARRMLVLARGAAIELFDVAGPMCVTEGICRELHPCGRPFSSVGEIIDEG